MWIFCKAGFFSAVEHRENNKNVLIRARFDGDIERLFAMYGKDYFPPDVNVTYNADYMYRAKISKTVLAVLVSRIAADIDYDNFKNSVHEGGGSKRDSAYMSCWFALNTAQNR